MKDLIKIFLKPILGYNFLPVGWLALGAGLLGGSAIAAATSKPKTPAIPEYPDPIDPGQSALDYILGISDPEVQAKILEAERRGRPEYLKLALQDIAGTALGFEGQPGTVDILEQITPRVSQIQSEALTQQRRADITDVEALGGRAIEAMRSADPEMQRLLAQQGAMTEELYGRAGQITPQQRRQAEQQARAAYSARGRGMGEASVAAEILGREDILRRQRDEARMAGQQYFGMLQATGADPFQAILGRPGTAYGGATQQQMFGANVAQGFQGTQLYDPDAGINLALQQQQNLAGYQSSIYGAQSSAAAANYASKMGLYGSLMQAGGSIIGGVCWIARECFGEQDERWLLFRQWLMTKAPEWFYNWYMENGEDVAAWLRDKPVLKGVIRWWMQGRINTLIKGFTNEVWQYN
jgi:hypothetical protein